MNKEPLSIPKPQILYIGPQGNYSDRIQYSTISECVAYCMSRNILGCDIETTRKYPLHTYKNENVYKPGLDPWLSDIVMLQVGDKEKIYVIDTRTEDVAPLVPVLQDKSKLFIGANLKFEGKHLQHKYNILLRNIYDVMITEQCLTNGLQYHRKDNPTGFRYSLEALAERHLGIKPVQQRDLFTQVDEEDLDEIYIDKSIRLGFLTIGENLFTEEQILYGSDDILYPILIRELQLNGWNGYNPVKLIELENKFCLVLADIEYRGMAFDKEQWVTTYRAKKVIQERRLRKLNEYVEKNHPKYCTPPDIFNTAPKCAIEWGSPKQVIKLFKELEICPQEKSKQTGKMEYTVGAKGLVKLLPNDYKEKYNNDEETEIVEKKDLILNYLLLGVADQCCTTFGEEWLKYIHPITGRVHTSYKQILNTGRISSTNPNLQQIPGDEDYRKAFIAEDGNILINCDYASQEGRVVADISGDEAMISFFNDGHPIHGDDFHSFTGTKMFSLMRNQPDLIISKKTHKDERNAAKTLGFKINYGGSAYTLKDDLGVTEEVAQEFIDSYLGAFPKLKGHFESSSKKAIENGYIEIDPITNRRYWEPKYARMKELKEKAWALYPKDYSKMSKEKKEEVKKRINEEHPEIKQYWKEMFTIEGELTRCSYNFPIQGTSGSQTKRSGVLFRNYQINNNLRDKIWITNLVHDEVVAEVTKEYAEEGRALIERCMKEGAQHFCRYVKMEAQAVITPFWAH